MFRYNPKANYQPNGGGYLQILSGKDLYKQMIVVSAMENDIFRKSRYHASSSEAFLLSTAENNSNPNGQKSNQLSFSHSRIIS